MSAEADFIAEVETPEACLAAMKRVLDLLSEEEGDFSCSVLITSPEEIRRLNREFRSVDSVTDVLSFPDDEEDAFKGDMAICLARAAEQARELGHSLAREMAFLALHGALHLHGMDHMEEGEAEEMYARQRKIMAEAGDD